MATTFVDYTGDGNATKSFSFPSIQESDIKVDVDGVIKSSGTHYNITGYTTTGGGNVVFTSGNIPASPAAIRIFRDTDVDNAKATYTAGSSVKAADLNANHEQLLFAAQEEQNQTVLTSDIKDGAVTSDKIFDGAIVNADINASAAIEGSKIQASSGSNAGTMSAANFTKLANIETAATADQTAAEIRTLVESASDSNVFTDADHSKLNAIEASATADQTASEIKTLLQSNKLTASEIANSAITTDKIADSELTTLAGMQAGTASKLADSTALTADIADLNQIDGMAKQTTITDDDTKFPTSGAIVDYVANQLSIFGGFTAIANESSFPNTQKASGAAVSISDAGGLVVNGSGTSTSATTVGGTTVTINNIPSSFHSSTIISGVRLIVTSTGSGQIYNYHKATIREEDLANLSGDINDFNERYRVGSTNPTSSNDAGDLFFNTGSGKLLVYNGTTSAWEETQSVGNFFINTLSSSSATGGGSATPNGTAYRFTLSNAGQDAQQHLVSVDGVIQKPNSGSSQPSEGFAIDSNDIIFGSAPVSGASIFVITIGASVSIGTPSNNTVTTAILQNGSVTTAKITDANVTTAKIADGAVTAAKLAGSITSSLLSNDSVTTAKIADDAVTAAKLASSAVVTDSIVDANVTTAKIADGNVTTAKIADDAVTAAKLANTSVSAGSYGSSTSIPSITVDAQGRITAASGNTVNTDLVGDTSPQLGGTLLTNGHNIDFADTEKARLGNGADLQIHHTSGQNYVEVVGDGNLNLTSATSVVIKTATNKDAVVCNNGGSTDLYHNNSKKLETTSGGVTVTGTCTATAFAGDGSALTGLGGGVPSGCILLWSGAVNALPTGYVLCDGNAGTPDLRGRFVVGGDDGTNYAVGDTGGANTVTLTTAQMPSHTHSYGVYRYNYGPYTRIFGSGNSVFKSNVTSSSTGGNQAHENRPPYYALCYIMKT